MSDVITVTKLNWRGEPVYSWTGTTVSRAGGDVVLRAVWSGPGSVQVTPRIIFEPGDVFYEYYYDNRPYGLWRVMTPDETVRKCWYCNVSTPAEMDSTAIRFRDLLLDVLVLPDGAYEVLDRDDLAHAVDAGLDPALARLAQESTEEIIDLLRHGGAPFGDG